MLRIGFSIGFLLMMVVNASLVTRSLDWWLYHIGVLITILLIWSLILSIKKRRNKN